MERAIGGLPLAYKLWRQDVINASQETVKTA
jgi:hypothetical protein